MLKVHIEGADCSGRLMPSFLIRKHPLRILSFNSRYFDATTILFTLTVREQTDFYTSRC